MVVWLNGSGLGWVGFVGWAGWLVGWLACRLVALVCWVLAWEVGELIGWAELLVALVVG